MNNARNMNGLDEISMCLVEHQFAVKLSLVQFGRRVNLLDDNDKDNDDSATQSRQVKYNQVEQWDALHKYCTCRIELMLVRY